MKYAKFWSLGLAALVFFPALLLVSTSGRDDVPEPVDLDGAEEGAESEGGGLKPELHFARIARKVAGGMPQAHILHEPLDDELAFKAVKNYLGALDFDHSVFFDHEIEGFLTQAPSLDDRLQGGDVDFAYRVFNRFLEHMSNRFDYVETLLEQGFDFTLEETILRDRTDSPWPATPEERNELWRKKVKNEYVAHRVGDTLRAEDAASGKTDPDEEELDAATQRVLNRSPEEKIRKRYEQFLSVLRGHDAQWVLQQYLSAFTRAYDSHSTYMSPRVSEDFDINMSLSLTGIGALLTLEDGAAKIVRLIPGGPAERDGRLKPNDKIIAVAQEGEEPVDILYLPLYKSVRLIRGPVGSEVRLQVIPASDASGTRVKTIALVRDEIKLEERAASSRVREVADATGITSNRLGVIELPDFYADLKGKKEEGARSSARDVERLLQAFQTNQVDGLLLDLRNNGGGSLPDAIELSGFFLDRGPIVQVKANRRVRSLRDPKPGSLFEKPMVVLVNRQSASASEILAAALQDYGRAVIVGDAKTHGKGTVQSVIPLDTRPRVFGAGLTGEESPPLGSLKVTSAAFFGVDGDSTQLRGITPDIILPSPLDSMEIGEEFLEHVLPWEQIDPAWYSPEGSVGDYISELDRRSRERRAQSESFNAYLDILERLKERSGMTEISLNLEQRLALAREGRELEALEEALTEQMRSPLPDAPASQSTAGTSDEADEADEEDAPGDVILEEALLILRDLVELEASPVVAAP